MRGWIVPTTGGLKGGEVNVAALNLLKIAKSLDAKVGEFFQQSNH